MDFEEGIETDCFSKKVTSPFEISSGAEPGAFEKIP